MSQPPLPEDDLPEQMRVRRAKYDRLRAAGSDPFPVAVPRTATAAALHAAFDQLPADHRTGQHESVAGRVVFKRDTGKLAFATLRDAGADIQVMLSLDQLGAAGLARWKEEVDLADHVSVTGEVITSRRGELSVLASDFVLAAKALRPPPAPHKPLSEEHRVRHRYLDLWLRPQARQLAQARIAMTRSLRETLQQRGFAEVETPMLQTVHGGASARPFRTHMNALDLDLYLRIAPELFLKRCIVGGLDKVFEINRNFRNEGMDASHSPEFAMLEAYEAYGDYDTMAQLTRELILNAVISVHGEPTVPRPDGSRYDLDRPWQQLSLHEAVSRQLGVEVSPDTPAASLRALAAERHLDVPAAAGAGEVLLALFDKLVEHTLTAPTFVRDYPVAVRPLTRGHRKDPRLTESWDLVIFGRELATAYSELVDPVVQRERLTEQSLRAAGGDPEAMALDEEFLAALEAGMPPTGGMGMGIDRLLMLITGATHIRETILFPLVKPS